MKRLVCVSNRIAIPRRAASAGGLAVGILSALQRTGGVWFGWSGETADTPRPDPEVLCRDNIRFTTIELESTVFDRYYNGYCNGSLWPLFHYAPDRFRHEQQDYEAYHTVNAHFATQLMKVLRSDDVVWVHDYHLMPLARYLREQRFAGPIGFFLHIPFPHRQVLRLLPNAAELVRDLCRYDLVGFQTDDDLQSFESNLEPTVQRVSPLAHGARIPIGRHSLRVGVYPIGVDVAHVLRDAIESTPEEPVQRLVASLLGRRLILGVDRLDYSKGLTERFAAFEEFLTSYPDNQGKVTFLQIAPLSRVDVRAYSEIRLTLEQTAGRLNGRFAEADWTPVRYLNRNFSHATLMGFMRAAQVALVTPMRDGMNLVAKEYVAAQDPADPGVLIVSPTAGAARELGGALLVNPYDKRGMALALETALHMSREERRRRHAQNMVALQRHDIHSWYGEFLRDLTGELSEAVRPAAESGWRQGWQSAGRGPSNTRH